MTLGSIYSSTCLSLGQLLATDRRLRIPVYQRAYAWTSRQAGRLLDDILTMMEEGEETGAADAGRFYFLGAMVLLGKNESGAPEDGETSGKIYDVIDGQQRLVSLTILLAVLRDHCLEAGDTAAAALADAAINADDTAGKTSQPRLSLRLSEAAFFESTVQRPGASLTEPDSAVPLGSAAQIMENLAGFRHEIANLDARKRRRLLSFLLERCVTAVIETTDIENAYRIYLTLNDRGLVLSRSSILKAYLLGDLTGDEQARLHETWAGWEASIGEQRLDELFSHVHKIAGRRGTPITTELLALGRQRGAARLLDDEIAPYARIFTHLAAIADGSSTPVSVVERYLHYLCWLRHSEWMPSALVALSRFGSEGEEINGFMRQLDRLSYAMLILGYGSDKRVVRYRAVLGALKSGDDKALAEALKISGTEQRNIIYNLSNDMHARNKPCCRLVLLRVNDWLTGDVTMEDPGSVTVEHVMPRNPRRDSQWTKSYSDPNERTRRVRWLGNLVLVRKEHNDAARNAEFPAKKEIFFPNGAAHPFALTDLLRERENWGPDDIAEHNALVMGIVKQMWGLT
ncbi:MAG: DUF262 domain-containing protein [Rhizobiales bacterium]|nr:DUF262 domain-containing protein [Hyphomicrobiales bacterium]